ncbi:hypothetical protein D3C72_1419500 [compost metagenome]
MIDFLTHGSGAVVAIGTIINRFFARSLMVFGASRRDRLLPRAEPAAHGRRSHPSCDAWPSEKHELLRLAAGPLAGKPHMVLQLTLPRQIGG